jgi:hypothetical protein
MKETWKNNGHAMTCKEKVSGRKKTNLIMGKTHVSKFFGAGICMRIS